MESRTPDEIFELFHEQLEKLRSAEQSVSPEEQRRIANSLGPVYNYVSLQTRSKDINNTLIWNSANNEKIRKQREEDQKNLTQHQKFVEANFDNADKYLKTIQLVGYTIFFTAIGFLRDSIPTHLEKWAILLLILSAFVFVSWEVLKATILSALLRKHSQVALSNLESFITNRTKNFKSKNRAILWFSKVRVFVWFGCVVPASFSLLILIYSIIVQILPTSPPEQAENIPNKAVDTTAANARLLDVDTSKATNPDVEAKPEAAVVSP